MRERPSRGISPGTLMMLLVTAMVIGGFVLVLPMLSAGGRPSTAQVDAQTGALLQPRRTDGIRLSASATVPPAATPVPTVRTTRQLRKTRNSSDITIWLFKTRSSVE